MSLSLVHMEEAPAWLRPLVSGAACMKISGQLCTWDGIKYSLVFIYTNAILPPNRLDIELFHLLMVKTSEI